MQTAVTNFLGLKAPLCEYEGARFAILPVPYDGTTSFRPGARFGPSAVLAASEQIEFFDDELGAEFHRCGIATLEALAPSAAGPQAVHEEVFRYSRRVVRDGKLLIALGGEHSITAGLVRAVSEQHGRVSVLQLDAHADLRESYQGSKHSHAAVMRRVLEHTDSLVPVGIRSYSQEEHDFIQGAGIAPITACECHTGREWVEKVLSRLGEKVYVTVDIDAFDPAYAPGTGTPEPGGLDWYQVTGLLRRVARERTIVGADVVEVAPLPGQSVTEYLAARLIYKLIGYIQTMA